MHQTTTQPTATATVQFDTALRCAARKATARYVGESARIDRGLAIALNGGVTYSAGYALVQSQADPEVTYAVNGGCDCPDAARAPEGRCNHRYAVALMRAATKLLAEATAQRYHAQYTSPAGEQILGIATRDEHSRITLFVPEDGREPLFPAPEALVLLGLVCMDRPADEEPLWKRIASPDYAAARSGK